MGEAGSSSYTSTKTNDHVRLNVEVDMRMHLTSVKVGIKDICENVKQCYSSIFCLS